MQLEKDNMKKEGYVKFECNWRKAKPLPKGEIVELCKWRQKLYSLGLIGANEQGIGFGNISKRAKKKGQFTITGTATGSIPELDGRHFATVTGFDLEKNTLECIGPIKASAESMTHGAIYVSGKKANAVIHVHSLAFWEKILGKVPTTSPNAEYGTPEIAKEIMRLFRETNVGEKKIIAMAGHKGGIICFGKSLEEAGKKLLEYCYSKE